MPRHPLSRIPPPILGMDPVRSQPLLMTGSQSKARVAHVYDEEDLVSPSSSYSLGLSSSSSTDRIDHRLQRPPTEGRESLRSSRANNSSDALRLDLLDADDDESGGGEGDDDTDQSTGRPTAPITITNTKPLSHNHSHSQTRTSSNGARQTSHGNADVYLSPELDASLLSSASLPPPSFDEFNELIVGHRERARESLRRRRDEEEFFDDSDVIDLDDEDDGNTGRETSAEDDKRQLRERTSKSSLSTVTPRQAISELLNDGEEEGVTDGDDFHDDRQDEERDDRTSRVIQLPPSQPGNANTNGHSSEPSKSSRSLTPPNQQRSAVLTLHRVNSPSSRSSIISSNHCNSNPKTHTVNIATDSAADDDFDDGNVTVLKTSERRTSMRDGGNTEEEEEEEEEDEGEHGLAGDEEGMDIRGTNKIAMEDDDDSDDDSSSGSDDDAGTSSDPAADEPSQSQSQPSPTVSQGRCTGTPTPTSSVLSVARSPLSLLTSSLRNNIHTTNSKQSNLPLAASRSPSPNLNNRVQTTLTASQTRGDDNSRLQNDTLLSDGNDDDNNDDEDENAEVSALVLQRRRERDKEKLAQMKEKHRSQRSQDSNNGHSGRSSSHKRSSKRKPKSKEDELLFTDLTFGERIGSGSYGEVFKGELWRQEVAIKRIRVDQLRASTQEFDSIVREFRREVRIMRHLRHPNVLEYLGVCETAHSLCLITEYCSAGSLEDQLIMLRKEGRRLRVSRAVTLALDVTRGLNWLHHKGIIHRDLKSANILIDANGKAKLADFGLSYIRRKNADSLKGKHGRAGTPSYIAPEVLMSAEYGPAADVFSFGVVLNEMLSGESPYDNTIYNDLPLNDFEAAVIDGARPSIASEAPVELQSLISECWNGDPALRPEVDATIARLEAIKQSHTQSQSLASQRPLTIDDAFDPLGVQAKLELDYARLLSVQAQIAAQEKKLAQVTEEMKQSQLTHARQAVG